MIKSGRKELYFGVALVVAFAIFTLLVQIVEVKPLGLNGTNIGFATINSIVHGFFGVNMILYTLTDWAGLVPAAVVLIWGVVGAVQLIKRGSLIKVDADILVLGVYYIVVAVFYVVFEMIPINYRPVLINGVAEASYPSSTTLLVLTVMPTLSEQMGRRCKANAVKTTVTVLTVAFSMLTVAGRLISGVHWFTDILGSVLLSVGLFYIYKGLILMYDRKA